MDSSKDLMKEVNEFIEKEIELVLINDKKCRECLRECLEGKFPVNQLYYFGGHIQARVEILGRLREKMEELEKDMK